MNNDNGITLRVIPIDNEFVGKMHYDAEGAKNHISGTGQYGITVYGTENGYNWQVGKTVAAYITYVPIQKAIEAARKSALTLLGYGLVGITLLSLVIWFSLEKYLVQPITRLEERATEISLGKNLDAKIVMTSNDEIGTLGQAIERMRISVTKLMERCRTKK